jgi:hypothetical protein
MTMIAPLKPPLHIPPDRCHRGRLVMVGVDLRHRDRKFKDGRHVGLDFYDLLIEVGLPDKCPRCDGFSVSNVRRCWWVLTSSGGMGVCLSYLSQVNQSET